MLNKSKNILLASHGTSGAQAAEQAVLNMCDDNVKFTHLYVIPEFWQHMLGDDWLNNAATRLRFENYLASELMQEAARHKLRIQNSFNQRGVPIEHKIVFGEPQKCLLNFCDRLNIDLVVMGSARPRFFPGLSSRMSTRKALRQLKTKVLQLPHPKA